MPENAQVRKRKTHHKRVLKADTNGVLEVLRLIATHGLHEQGSEKALELAESIFFYQKGTEKLSVDREDIGRLIHQ